MQENKADGLIFFQSSDSYLFSEVTQILPDPLAQIIPFIPSPRAPEISTIRLLNQVVYDWTDWQIIQDDRQNSVVAGLASVGGLWTSVGGLFLIIFGTSVFRILFGE